MGEGDGLSNVPPVMTQLVRLPSQIWRLCPSSVSKFVYNRPFVSRVPRIMRNAIVRTTSFHFSRDGFGMEGFGMLPLYIL